MYSTFKLLRGVEHHAGIQSNSVGSQDDEFSNHMGSHSGVTRNEVEANPEHSIDRINSECRRHTAPIKRFHPTTDEESEYYLTPPSLSLLAELLIAQSSPVQSFIHQSNPYC